MEDSIAVAVGAAVGVVIASEGYPDAPLTGRRLEGAEPSGPADDGTALCFHAGTRRLGDGAYETTGGRVVTMVGRGPSLAAARDAAYGAVERVALDGGQYRADVAERELHVGDRAQLGDEAR